MTACGPTPGDSSETGTASTTSTATPDPTTGTDPTGPGNTVEACGIVGCATTTTGPEPTSEPANTVEACGIVGCDTTVATTVATSGDIPEHCPGYQQLDPACPDGFKCTIDGGISQTQCAPIMPNPKGLGEPCTVTGDAQSGIDDCGLAMLCWNVDDQGHGTCIGLCNEDNGEFTCQDPAATCTGLTCQSCAVSLCLAACNPLLHQCAEGEVCIPDNNTFLCVPDASGTGGQVHGACEFVNACDDGLACVDAVKAASECDDQVQGCCEPYCDLDQPDCPAMGQTCTPWFTDDPPPGLEKLGVCLLK